MNKTTGDIVKIGNALATVKNVDAQGVHVNGLHTGVFQDENICEHWKSVSLPDLSNAELDAGHALLQRASELEEAADYLRRHGNLVLHCRLDKNKDTTSRLLQRLDFLCQAGDTILPTEDGELHIWSNSVEVRTPPPAGPFQYRMQHYSYEDMKWTMTPGDIGSSFATSVGSAQAVSEEEIIRLDALVTKVALEYYG